MKDVMIFVCFQTLTMSVGEFLSSTDNSEIYSPFNVIDIDTRHRDPRPFELPRCVRDQSIAHIFCPKDVHPRMDPKNGVSDYLLLGQKGSITDFHQDFSHTSVFYMVLKGQKDFFLVRPTPHNLEAFAQWGNWTNVSSRHADRRMR